MAGLPLDGIKVADFSWVLNGPQIGTWLASMGAEVIKVESQVYPDIMRLLPGTMADSVTGVNRSGGYHNVNYGKKCVTLNLGTPKGKELAYRLVKRADITLECFTRPVAKRLGLTYDSLKAVKEDVILLSCSLLGKQGLEQADWTGYGMLAIAFVGECDAQAYPGGRARQTGGTWPDYAVAGGAVFHLMAALEHRRRTGQGQWIDLAMSESVISWMPEWYIDHFMNDHDRRARANTDDIMAPHNTYRCAGEDKWIAIAVGNDDEWQALREVMQNPEWAASERFADQFRRWQNREDLDRHVSEWTKGHDYLKLAKKLQQAGVPAGPVMSAQDASEDPHLWEWGYWWKEQHSEAGERVMPGIPVRMSNISDFNFTPAPNFGEHNQEVLGGILGLSDEEIARLTEEKIVY